jgi:putative transposase
MDRIHDGKAFRMLTIIDEFTRESLAIHVKRKLNSQDVLHMLGKLFMCHGRPEHVRSDNGPEFVDQTVRAEETGCEDALHRPGSPWENGYCENFSGKLRDECRNHEIFYTLREAQILIEQWRRFYDTERPHSSLGYRPPAPKMVSPSPIPVAYTASRADQPAAYVHARL